MQIFEAIPTSLYLFSQVVAGIGAFAIFLYAIISGFKSKPDPGSNPYAHTGAVIFGSILAAYLAVGPILTYDQIYPEATFPRPGFALAWWIAFAILIILGIALNFKDFRKHPRLCMAVGASYPVPGGHVRRLGGKNCQRHRPCFHYFYPGRPRLWIVGGDLHRPVCFRSGHGCIFCDR